MISEEVLTIFATLVDGIRMESELDRKNCNEFIAFKTLLHICTANGMNPYELKARLQEFFSNTILNPADGVMCVSWIYQNIRGMQ